MLKNLAMFIKQYAMRLVFFLALSTSALTLFLVNKINEARGVDNSLWSDLSPLALLIGVLLFIGLLVEGSKAQIIHRRQWSWFRLTVYVCGTVVTILAYLYDSLALRVFLLTCFSVLGVIYLLLFFVRKTARRKLLHATFRYAHATPGGDYDLLEYKPAAKNFGAGLASLSLPVQVVALTGVMGEGKSTFWRMTAEDFEKENTLHTYISLTEINSKTDFSKLFSERWFQTLKERYAFLLSTQYTEESRLYKILRDNGNGLIKTLAEALLVFNIGLFRTKTQKDPKTQTPLTDPLSETQNTDYVSREVARAFNNIPEIYEDRWFIVIDELERSPIEEVYRLIEVIERFRQLGKDGLPIQLVFVLCFDAAHFINMKPNPSDSEHGEKVALVKDFVTNTSLKSVDIFQGVPVSSLNRRLELVLSKLKEVLPEKVFAQSDGKLQYDFLDGIYDVEVSDFKSINHVVEGQGDYKFKDVFDYLLLKLTAQPTRASVRLTQQVEFSMHSFSEQNEEWLANINVSTLMAYQYIRLLRPGLLPFIGVSYVHFDPDLKSFFTMHNGFISGFRSGSGDEDTRSLKERVLEHTGIDTSLYDETELEAILEDLDVLVPVVGKYMRDGLDPYSNDVVKYKGTLSDPDVLKWFLSNNRTELTEMGRFTELFEKVESINLADFSSGENLADFSGFARNRVNYAQKTPEKSLQIAKMIYDFMIKNKRLVEPSSLQMDKNILDKLTYEFVFQIQEASFGYEVQESTQEEAAALYDDFVRSKSIKYESKLIALDAFLDRSGSGLDRIRTREEVFEKLRGKEYFMHLFNDVRKFIIDEYAAKGNRTIYNQEANVFYVQYQLWNGTVEDTTLDGIRKMAKKSLGTNAKALNLLWSVYPYESRWTDYASMSNSRDHSIATMSPSRRGMYVTLQEMVSFTKQNTAFRKLMTNDAQLRAKVDFWTRIQSGEEYAKQEANLTPTNETVGAKVRDLYDHYRAKGLIKND